MFREQLTSLRVDLCQSVSNSQDGIKGDFSEAQLNFEIHDKRWSHLQFVGDHMIAEISAATNVFFQVKSLLSSLSV